MLLTVFAVLPVLVALLAAPVNAKTGSGGPGALVFVPNPVAETGNESLTDQKDAASAVPTSVYHQVPLPALDGSGYLSGLYATVKSETGNAAYSPSGSFAYNRHQDEFEQVMAYYWVTQAQLYLQSLGFGSNLPAVNRRPVPVRINQYGGDNSFFRDNKTDLTFGKGGVDDAEDAEVIVHEYGHSVQNAQVAGFGTTPDAGAIGEGFSDYLAVEVSNWVAKSLGVTTRVADACVADWDSTSYDTAADDGLYCLRRVDSSKHYPEDLHPSREVHADGELWSAALYRMRNLLADPKTADIIIIGAQFGFTAGTTFDAAARATYAYAKGHYPAKAAKVRQAFVERGFSVPA
ncbi:MAG: zinc metalloprotease ZmpB [Frankiales bacterium]|jgi:hypothetical protein|nr:zinc metalloprotease ZmpB [Frankiales bacterium]